MKSFLFQCLFVVLSSLFCGVLLGIIMVMLSLPQEEDLFGKIFTLGFFTGGMLAPVLIHRIWKEQIKKATPIYILAGVISLSISATLFYYSELMGFLILPIIVLLIVLFLVLQFTFFYIKDGGLI